MPPSLALMPSPNLPTPQSTVIVCFSDHGYQVTSSTSEFHYLLPCGYDPNRIYQIAIGEQSTRADAPIS